MGRSEDNPAGSRVRPLLSHGDWPAMMADPSLVATPGGHAQTKNERRALRTRLGGRAWGRDRGTWGGRPPRVRHELDVETVRTSQARLENVFRYPDEAALPPV